MKTLALALVVALGCGDDIVIPDASTLPSCSSLGCEPPTLSRECAAHGTGCTCHPPGTPRTEPAIPCSL